MMKISSGNIFKSFADNKGYGWYASLVDSNDASEKIILVS